MRYIAGDIETTCLSPAEPNRMIQLSLVFDDTDNPIPVDQLPHFTVIIAHDEYKGEAYALDMNNWIFKEIIKHERNIRDFSKLQLPTKYPVMSLQQAINGAINFIRTHFPKGGAILAGKNVGKFDYQFFPPELQSMFHYAFMDVGSMHIDYSKSRVPSSVDLAEKFSLPPVTHDAYDDNLGSVQLVRLDVVHKKILENALKSLGSTPEKNEESI